jgi:hypothetical protein
MKQRPHKKAAGRGTLGNRRTSPFARRARRVKLRAPRALSKPRAAGLAAIFLIRRDRRNIAFFAVTFASNRQTTRRRRSCDERGILELPSGQHQPNGQAGDPRQIRHAKVAQHVQRRTDCIFD